MNSLSCKRTDSTDADFRCLVIELDQDLAIRNGSSHDFYAQFNKSDLIKHVVVAYMDQHPVAIGALRAYDSQSVEIKRMYVRADKRGKGIASMVLRNLEKWALELGFTRCILETGYMQPEAIALYKKSNYTIIPNYPPYEDTKESVCMEKILSST